MPWRSRGLVIGVLALATSSSVFLQGAPQGPVRVSSTTTTSSALEVVPVSGRVVLRDGDDLPDRVTIERVCSGGVRSEGQTDAKGYFSLELLQSRGILVTTSSAPQQGASPPRNAAPSPSAAIRVPTCELRGKLAGYYSTSVLLGTHLKDNPDVGAIVLYPLVQGSGVSSTSAAAPKDAKKAYQQGLDALKKNKLADAEKNFRKAAAIYPQYAGAWAQLGKVLLGTRQNAAARDALNHALDADPRDLNALEQLYLLAFNESNWQELADATERLLQVNRYEFPLAVYYNGVAHYQLGHLPEAEKSLWEAMILDHRNQIPKVRYVLGMISYSQKNYAEAAQLFQVFLYGAPDDPMAGKVNAILAEIAQRPETQP